MLNFFPSFYSAELSPPLPGSLNWIEHIIPLVLLKTPLTLRCTNCIKPRALTTKIAFIRPSWVTPGNPHRNQIVEPSEKNWLIDRNLFSWGGSVFLGSILTFILIFVFLTSNIKQLRQETFFLLWYVYKLWVPARTP